jgi:hypothetical protein
LVLYVPAGAAGMRMQGICSRLQNHTHYNDFLQLHMPAILNCVSAGAADMSMRDVSTVYNKVIQELSLNLALHEAATQDAAEVGDAAAPYSGPHSQLQLQGIQAAFDRWG